MVNYYYDDITGEDVLVVDIDQKMYVVVADYAEWISENPEDYDYKNATYYLKKKPYRGDGTLLNDNEIFLSTLKHDGKNLYRNIIREVLQ